MAYKPKAPYIVRVDGKWIVTTAEIAYKSHAIRKGPYITKAAAKFAADDLNGKNS